MKAFAKVISANTGTELENRLNIYIGSVSDVISVSYSVRDTLVKDGEGSQDGVVYSALLIYKL